MNDLISRQAAIDALDEIEAEVADGYGYQYAKWREYFVEMPSAQHEPHEGHWIWVAGELMCSECRTIYSDLYPDYDNSVACPHCGCKMEVEHDSDLHAE